MAGVLLLSFVLVVVLLVCAFLQSGFPVVLTVTSILIALMVVAGGGNMAEGILGGGTVLVGGMILATASDTYEEIRLARRRARPRRRPRVPVTNRPEAEPELHERSRAA